MIKLRSYQTSLISEVRKSFVQGHNHVVMQSATGSGKTIMFSFMVKEASSRGKRCLILTNRIELLEQASGTFDKLSITYENITASTRAIPRALVNVAMVETMKRRAVARLDFQMFLKSVDLLIVDECFIAGTKVSGKNIEDIIPGDFVESFNHKTNKIELKKVLNTSKKLISNDLLLIKTQYDSIVCTHNHPIFVKNKGYIPVQNLKIGDIVYGRSLFKQRRFTFFLRSMFKRNEFRNIRTKKNASNKEAGTKKRQSFLFSFLRCFFQFCNAFRANDKKQSYIKSRNSKKSFGQFKKNWTQTCDPRRKWQRINKTANDAFITIRKWVVSRVSYNNREWLFTLQLQNRYWESRKKNSNRNKWKLSQFFNSEKKRFKKKESIREQRIQSIELYKYRNINRCDGSSSKDFVYNLEIEDNNNYFANNILVHNCHVAAFDPIFAYLKSECYIIGATATPIRQNAKKPLSDNFTALVTGPSISSLIQDGFLSKPKYFGVSVDLSKVKMKAGEFDERDQEKVFLETKVFEGLKENLEMHAKGLKTMIFCPSVASSKQVAHDLKCLHVDGTMSSEERDKVLTQFESTPGAIITNCAITTTGYDHPGIECIVLYRATTSLPLYLQMIGRGSRVTPDKTQFTILDFGMNIQRHGYWHIDRTWSLKPPKKAKKSKDSFPIKFCPQCGAIVGVNIKVCTECGYVWQQTEKERVFVELQELHYNEVEKRMNSSTIEEMEALRIAKRYKIGFVLHRFKTIEQFEQYGKLKNYHPKWAAIQAERYLHL